MVQDLELSKGRYGVGVSWNKLTGRNVDIDLQCVVVDGAGAIVDCAYYNNLKAARGVTHSGDQTIAKPSGIDEMVWVTFRKLPPDVGLLIFLVAAYSGGSLQDVANGCLHVMEESEVNKLQTFAMERSTGCVDVVAAIHRVGTRWKLRVLDIPAQSGQHFMDILPLLSQVIRTFQPSAPQRQKVAFAMEKGGVLDLPRDLALVTVGLGWDTDEGEVDLDVSAVLLSSDGTELESVFFGRLESARHGIRHSGDNLTGDGDGDDEQIAANLMQIGQEVQQLIFCVNIYSQGRTFAQVAQPYCRIVDSGSDSELCRYSLRDAGAQSGLIIARLAREAGGRWGFHALGLPCRGRTYKDSLPEIRAASSCITCSLMARGLSTESLGGAAVWSAPVPSAPTAPAATSEAQAFMAPGAARDGPRRSPSLPLRRSPSSLAKLPRCLGGEPQCCCTM